MKKYLLFFLLLIVYHLSLFASQAEAVCPVCTIAVGAGLGLSRYFGIDDIISGLWVGGLILSSALWMADWLHKKGVQIKIRILNIVSCIAFYLLVIVPLYLTNIIGHPYNTIYGVDRLVFGVAIGSIVFLAALSLDKYIRKVNGKQLFSYQKVVFPVLALVIISFILYIGLKS